MTFQKRALTPRSVLNRLKKLEKVKIVQGYSVKLNTTLFETKCGMLILLKFVPSCDNGEIENLSSTLCDSPNCSVAIRLVGGANGYDCALPFSI